VGDNIAASAVSPSSTSTEVTELHPNAGEVLNGIPSDGEVRGKKRDALSTGDVTGRTLTTGGGLVMR
jgi:hypothetical protein